MSMERLTEKHYGSGDNYMKCSVNCAHECTEAFDCERLYEFIDRLGNIEDILGDTYDLDRLRELVAADKDGRCVLLPVKPNLKPGVEESRCFILLDNGEFVDDNVYNVSIGPDNNCKMNTIYSTFDFGDFELSEVGHRIFWDENNVREAAESALAKEADHE